MPRWTRGPWGLCLAWAVLSSVEAAAQVPTAEPWRAAYTGADAEGPHVLGLWKFDAGAVAQDSGPLKLHGKLDGAVAAAAGRFGGAWEGFPGWPVEDQRHALLIPAHPALSPSDAFAAELWLRPKPELAAAGAVYLLDKKYVAHQDYQWQLGPPDKSGARRMVVHLGFGSESESFASEPVSLPPDAWRHAAFSYDGAGTVRFYLDGSSVGTVSRPGRRGVTAGKSGLSIGDRLGSHYGGFPGYLDEVRLCRGALEFSPAALTLQAQRTVWLRTEPSPGVRVHVVNLLKEPLAGAKLTWSGLGASAKTVDLPRLTPGGTHELLVPLDTRLRPDDYALRVRLSVPGEPPVVREETLALKLMPRPLPRMPVVMWGIGSPAEFARELPRLKDLGFTHCLGFAPDTATPWGRDEPAPAHGPEMIAAVERMFDTALAHELRIAASISVGPFLKARPELARVDRQGQPYPRHDCNAALPGLAAYAERVGRGVGQTYGRHPAFEATLVNSEVRDDAALSFSEFDRAAYRRFSGQEIPDEAIQKWGVQWSKLPNFPADRVIPDDHPLRRFYHWYWTVGDGWNGLHTAVHRGLKATSREGVWTWFDPAIRAPSIAGSGGEVDVLGQWTYTDPGPLRVGYFCDELLAMAEASGRGQRVMKMTQLFWYRSSTAPRLAGGRHIPSPFDDHDPDAAYISISPAHLRGAFWSMLARPVAGVMYHGWSSLVPTDGTHGYKYTQPDLQTEFRRLHHDVLPALGPALLRVPDRPSEVAYLDSFTAQMFAGRGSYGYAHDEAYLTLLHAQLQPQVLFEETLLARGLDGFRVLVLADCDVLPASVVEKIRAFQDRGGLVVGDERLAPAIRPDVVLPHFTREKQAAADKATLLSHAAALRAALDARFPRYAETTNPELVTRVRGNGASEYLFVINDHREAGSYVGQHGLVLEHGLPSAGQVRVRRSATHVYDLVARREVEVARADGLVTWPVQLGPCEGRVYLLTPAPIERVAIDGPATAQPGTALEVAVTVATAAGSPVPAVIPLEVSIRDPAGRPAEFSGYQAAVDGQLRLRLELAANDLPGVWEIAVRELASGREAARYFRLETPRP